MVFYIRSRRGYENIMQIIGSSIQWPIWVDKNILSEVELGELRRGGLDVTNFNVGGPGDKLDLGVVKEHHPDDVIWVEH